MSRDTFQTVTDPTRRAIIVTCISGNDIKRYCRKFQYTSTSCLNHLRILTEYELIKQEQKGREIYYSLEIDKMKEFYKWIAQFRKIWEIRQLLINH